MSAAPNFVVELEVPARLAFRDVALRAAAASCKIVAGETPRCEPTELTEQVVSSLGEAFNNTVLHAYRDRDDGRVTIEIEIQRNALEIRVIDYGVSFDIATVLPADTEELRESGMGLFIMRAFMDDIEYRAGPPNILCLRKFF